jgi:hypothetical protein
VAAVRETGKEEYRWLGGLAALTAIALTAAFAVGTALGVPTAEVLLGYAAIIWAFVPPMFTIALLIFFCRCAVMRVDSPVAALRPFLRQRFGSPALATASLAPILLMPLFMGAFGTLKQIMPLVRPFSWDVSFAALDRALFLGAQPWQLTHALFGSPQATMVIDRLYTGWVPLLFVAVLCFSIFAPRYLRARFFLSFAASWLLIGVVGAFLFASAGPCYAHLIGATAADYAPLMERLHAVHTSGHQLGAVNWQEVLWTAHTTRDYGFAMGVSAMPSMHNAITMLYVLALWGCSPAVRSLTIAFAVTILIGSVHLGWHYAVDGLFAWAAAGAIWVAAGRYLRWAGYDPQPASLEPAGDGGTVPGEAAPAL